MGKKIRVTVDVDKLSRAGGHARAAAMTADQLSKAAKKASEARWAKYYAAHPEKKKTARTGASRKQIKKMASR